MKTKPKNPYTELLKEAQDYVRQWTSPEKRGMWCYPKSRLGDPWNLSELHERVGAADQLGYDVKLENRPDGLHVVYVKRPTKAPWWA